MKVRRPTHTHECQRCRQPYRCDGETAEGCEWVTFQKWDHCPACVEQMAQERP